MAAGLIITRASSQGFLTTQLLEQGGRFPRIFYICALLTFLIPFLHGFPKIPFWILTIGLVFLGRWAEQKGERRIKESESLHSDDTHEKRREEDLYEALQIDPISLEVGHGLVHFIDPGQKGELIDRARALRTQIANELGFIIPPINLRDNLQLKAYDYEISLRGNSLTRGSLKPHQLMALDPGHVTEPLEGETTKEPVYGMDAIWISEDEKQTALLKGYLVVNLPTIMTTHLSKILKSNAKELLGRSELKQRLDQIQEQSPKLVEDVIHPDRLTHGDVLRVLHRLLEEEVSIKDLVKILDCLADQCRYTKNPDLLAEQCRQALSRSIVRQYLNGESALFITSFERALEDRLRGVLDHTEQGTPFLKVDPQLARELIEKLGAVIEKFDEAATTPVLVLSTALRFAWRQILSAYLPQYAVLAFDEIPRDVNVKVLQLIQ
jgi:flagellar biosynthesis protein FlhA